MSKKKEFNVLHRITCRNARDLALFGYVFGAMRNNPAVSLSLAIQDFNHLFGTTWDEDVAKTTWYRMVKEFRDDPTGLSNNFNVSEK